MTFSFRKLFSTVIPVLILAAVFLIVACTPVLGKPQTKMISKLEANYSAVFPLANTQIKCTATDPGGGALTYKWTCNQGSIEGSGSEITWIAPNQLGWFPVMVTVENSAGQIDEQIIKIAVVEKNSENCPTCPGR